METQKRAIESYDRTLDVVRQGCGCDGCIVLCLLPAHLDMISLTKVEIELIKRVVRRNEIRESMARLEQMDPER